MSADDDALRAMAANRGCRLVKSQVRTPGRKDYGKFGLKDAKNGREVFGFGKRGLTADAGEIEQFLRGGSTATWKTSLGSTPVKKRKPEPKPKEKPQPKLKIRDARPGDANVLAELIGELGYEVTPAEVRARLAALKKDKRPVLVAERGELIGCCSLSIMLVLHRPKPVGRISMMVVAEAARGQGIGTALVEAALERLKAAGCGLVEVTSNVKRMRAHAFYEKLGFERTSYRFAKTVA